MEIKEKFIQAIRGYSTVGVVSVKCERISHEFAISFHNWMRKNDTPENAEKFFHYTDEDMLNVFKEETGW